MSDIYGNQTGFVSRFWDVLRSQKDRSTWPSQKPLTTIKVKIQGGGNYEISSSNRKYQPYPLSYFPWLCAWDVCYIIFCHLLHIHSGKTGILFSLLLCSLWWVQIIGYVLASRSCSFVCTLHHLIIIIVKLIWRHWTYKMPVRYILSSVWVRLSIFSQLSIEHYMGLCVFSLPISLVMTERIFCLIFIIKSEVWTIIHCLGLGHETMVCAVCLSLFLYNRFPISK